MIYAEELKKAIAFQKKHQAYCNVYNLLDALITVGEELLKENEELKSKAIEIGNECISRSFELHHLQKLVDDLAIQATPTHADKSDSSVREMWIESHIFNRLLAAASKSDHIHDVGKKVEEKSCDTCLNGTNNMLGCSLSEVTCDACIWGDRKHWQLKEASNEH